MPLVNRLPGTSDKNSAEIEYLRSIEEPVQGLLASYDYSSIQTPVIEYTDLFLRKSGGELASRLYSFQDPGGKYVSLRPEFTSSCIRYFIENQQDLEVPLRIQYAGPVFRYNPGTGYTESYQIGAELIGIDSPDSDAEILSLALEGASYFNGGDIECKVGHIGILGQILSSIGISQRGQNFLIGNLHLLTGSAEGEDTLLDQARSVGLIAQEGKMDDSINPIKDMEKSKALSLLSDLFKDSLTDPLGNRSSEDILDRFLSNYSRTDEYDSFVAGIAILNDILKSSGEYKGTIERLKELMVINDIDSSLLNPITEIIEHLQRRTPEAKVTLDLGLVRGIAYYTGMVFEIYDQSESNSSEAICGGGRYDGLVKALGGNNDVPALGFAYSLAGINR